jgi:glycosyltransferase involved in cell wall biosynthesis
MKCLHVVNISFVLPYYIGDQFDNFQKLGLKTYVACSPSEHLKQYSIEKKFNPIFVDILREINPVSDLKAILFLRRKINEEQIDIVIGHTPKGAMIAMIAAYLAGVNKRIYFRHGIMYETSKGTKAFLLKTIEKLTGKLATKVVCVSKSVIEKSITENLNKPCKNILLNLGTCNGIDSIRFSKQNITASSQIFLREKYQIKLEDRIVGYVGRLVNDKGINELISAWKIIKQKRGDVKLLLVGPFEARDSISEKLKQLIKADNSIIHTGLISDVLPYYGLMDIFILPSYREGFPTVVLEASSMAIPIITTRSTGCVDSIVENETGVYCDLSPIDIADKIGFYLSNKNIATRHGENGRDFVVNNFQQEIIWKEIETKVLEISR